MKRCWHKEEKQQNNLNSGTTQNFGGIYLAKVISNVFWNADICSYGCEDRLLHLHVVVQMHCCLTGVCHFKRKMRVSKQGYRSLALPGKAKLLEVRGHPLWKLAQRSKESILHQSPEQPSLSHRISAFKSFLQTCLLCKYLSRGSAVMIAFNASGYILTLLKSSCHHIPLCCRRDLSIGMEIMVRQLLSENKMQIYDTVSII